MRFETVIRLLFATTVVSVFSYLLFFVAIGQAGNGGEYWGFNGLEEPYSAASRILESGDRRLLRIDLSTPLGGKVSELPLGTYCNEVPFGHDLPSRPSIDKLVHGADSVELARQFAHRYNTQMAASIGSDRGLQCQITRYWMGSTLAPGSNQDWLGFLVLAFYVTLILTAFLLWPGRRFFKRRLRFVQSKIRDREKSLRKKK